MKRKIVFSVFIFFILFLLSPAKSVYAGFSCSVNPSTASPNANATIDGGGNFSQTKKFYVSVNGNKIGAIAGYRGISGTIGTLFSPVSGIITFKLPSAYTSGTLSIGVYMEENSGTNLCSNNPTIAISNPSGSGSGDSCNLIPVKPDPFTPKPSDYVSFRITGGLSSVNSTDQLHTYIKIGNNDGTTVWDGCIKKSDLTNSFGFGYFTSGNYYLEVKNGCTPFHVGEQNACNATFNVDPAGGALGGTGNKEDPIPPGPCSAGANSKGNCSKIDTGLGISIGTNPKSLIQTLFGLILSISGGIALLLIIISGYRVLSSQGNPEALKGAREQLTSAIVGLLFIILSLVILQVIGIDILHIPGFS